MSPVAMGTRSWKESPVVIGVVALLVVALLAVVQLMILPATAASLADDNFDGNSLDSARWSPYVNPPGIGTVTQRNGRLEVTLNPGAANVGLNGHCYVAGDFDVQVDFLLLNWPANNHQTVSLGLADLGSGTFGLYNVQRFSGSTESYMMVLPESVAGSAPTSGTGGKLRWVRTSSTLTGYYDNGAGFVPLASTTVPTVPTRVVFNVGSFNPNGGAVSVAYDNFIVNAGTVNCPVLSAVALAKSVSGASYLWGGKGWDYLHKEYVPSSTILNGFYTYYRPETDAFGNTDPNGGKLDSRGAGLDCSGLILWAYNKAVGGTAFVPDTAPCSLPICYENANGQFLYNTQHISQSEPGDLLFFNFSAAGYNAECLDPSSGLLCATHVAMYVGGNDVIQATAPGGTVKLSSNFSSLVQKVIPNGLRRVSNPMAGLVVKSGSPIGLIVTDPNGFTITPNTLVVTDSEAVREIPGVLYYSVTGVDANGFSEDAVYAPTLKDGDYIVQATAKLGASASDTYSLTVTVAGHPITLAKDVPLGNIPSLGYGLRSIGGALSQFVPVAIVIKPGSRGSPLSLRSKGRIPVVILSSATVNAPVDVDISSLSFGRTGDEPSFAFCNAGGVDVNGDGLPDLMCFFDAQSTAFRPGDTQGILRGKTLTGTLITGKTSVRIVP